ncbi:MAG: hypothetical protein ED556_08055 [Winogradskyella sp.]|uniref:hypothetical protein n=1 Tax=Winogradskyella sp. TaxID=1883156 RepID=UPI000F3E7AEB|nr:hypothetical protein [Winogradskyella sp.]RNC86242.1 MAG: hypothetical protein ED556_08055 [Winogradskyella sp.]
MKTKPQLLSTIFIILVYVSFAQTSNNEFKSIDFIQNTMSEATIADYNERTTKFKLTGTLYLADGTTPAANHKITLNQADEDGNFKFYKENGVKILRHAATLTTDANGKYTFYTFVPGGDRLYNQIQELYLKVELPDQTEYALPSLFFDSDPMLSKRCRKKMLKRGEEKRILILKDTNNLLEVTHDFIVSSNLKPIQ